MSTPPISNASQLIHLAPPSLSALSSDEVKSLVLDYLSSCCFPDSAEAFAREAYQLNGGVVNFNSVGNGTEPIENGSQSSFNGNGIESNRNGMEIESEIISSRSANLPPSVDYDGDDVMDGDTTLETLQLDKNGNKVESQSEMEVEPSVSNNSVLQQLQSDQIRLRRDIRDHIFAGRIQLAIDLIQRHFPSVLLSVSESNTTLQRSYSPIHFFLHSSPIPPTGSIAVPPYASPDTTGPSSLVLRPMIISLYLHLQSWVEMVRTASIASEGTSTRPSTPITLASHLQSTLDDDDSNELHDSALSGSTSSLASITSTRTSTANLVVAKAQQMYRMLQDMESEFTSKAEKSLYEKEVLDFTALLAYRDINAAPENVKKYLDFDRRIALADLVGAAILVSMDKTATPILSLAVRQTTAIWSALGEWKVSLPGSSKSNGSSSKDKKVKEKEVLPKFDLTEFLNEV